MAEFRSTMIVCCVAVLLLFSVSASAAFKRDYTIAKKSFEDADYADAIKKLKAAIADNPNPAARVKLYGMRFDSYLPYYFLGQAYFKLENCSSAIAAWDQAIKAGVIQKKNEFAQMQADMKACKSQNVDVSSIAAQAGADIDALESAISNYARLQNEALLAPEWSSKWQPRLQQATQLAQALRQRLQQAVQETDAGTIKSVSKQAQRNAALLSGSEKDGLAKVKAIQTRNAENERAAQEVARGSLQEAIRLANTAEEPAGGSAQMTSLFANLQRQVSVGEKLGLTASMLNIKEQTQIIENVLRRYKVSVQNWQAQKQSIADRTPPAGLKRIAEAYFSGDYETAARLADPKGFDKERTRIQALLFRAAANHKLYVRSGEKQAQTLRQVQNDIREIKRMDKRFSPYIAAFSPRFLTLFRKTG